MNTKETLALGEALIRLKRNSDFILLHDYFINSKKNQAVSELYDRNVLGTEKEALLTLSAISYLENTLNTINEEYESKKRYLNSLENDNDLS